MIAQLLYLPLSLLPQLLLHNFLPAFPVPAFPNSGRRSTFHRMAIRLLQVLVLIRLFITRDGG